MMLGAKQVGDEITALAVGEVSCYDAMRRAELGSQRLQAGFVPCNRRDDESIASECTRERMADAFTGTGDQGAASQWARRAQ
jgi:hypothetical protein